MRRERKNDGRSPERSVGADGGTLLLVDGTRVPVRRVGAGDAAALQRLVGRSSDRSVELRFFGPLKGLSDEMAERFADVDGESRFALVALDPADRGEIVGVVRYEREGDTDGALPGMGLGLLDAAAADVHLVVRDHGPAKPGMIVEQIQTFDDFCNPTCTDLQMSIHPAAG